MRPVYLLLDIVIYIAVCRLILTWMRGTWREAAFALANLAGYYEFFVRGHFENQHLHELTLAIYLALILAFFAAVQLYAEKGGWKTWVAFSLPLLALIVIRYLPASCYPANRDALHALLAQNPDFTIAPYFLGISYLAFRCSYLVLEVRNGAVKKPGFWEYLAFCFFVPTMSIGPINPYSNYRRGFEASTPTFPMDVALLRILVGFIKYLFLGTIFNQLSYSGLLLDDHYHPWFDLPISMVFYYLYIYCNFSGFCDIAIGGAALIGIPVIENFQDPFAARNMREFWNRWHISLSQYMRDVLFSPLSKYLARLFGPANVNHAVAVTILVVFLLIGIWHGIGWNYAVFGLLQAIGVIVTHYYTNALKKWLGRDSYKAYMTSRWIHAAAVTVTFCYFAMTLFFFACSPAEIREILSILR